MSLTDKKHRSVALSGQSRWGWPQAPDLGGRKQPFRKPGAIPNSFWNNCEPHTSLKWKMNTKNHYACVGRTELLQGAFRPGPEICLPPPALLYSRPAPPMPRRHFFQMHRARLHPSGRWLRSGGDEGASRGKAKRSASWPRALDNHNRVGSDCWRPDWGQGHSCGWDPGVKLFSRSPGTKPIQ